MNDRSAPWLLWGTLVSALLSALLVGSVGL
jgi:hypothetical protein